MVEEEKGEDEVMMVMKMARTTIHNGLLQTILPKPWTVLRTSARTTS